MQNWVEIVLSAFRAGLSIGSLTVSSGVLLLLHFVQYKTESQL